MGAFFAGAGIVAGFLGGLLGSLPALILGIVLFSAAFLFSD